MLLRSLKYLSAQKIASNKNLSKQDLKRLPLDVHDDIRKHLSKEKQIKLWDGEYKHWYDSGQIEKHCWYNKDGATSQQRGCTGTPPNGECSKLDGEYKRWYDNGQLAAHCWYKDNKRDGEYSLWYKNGQLWVHCWYKNNKRDGEYKLCLANGKLWKHCWFKDGKRIKKNK